MKPELYIDPDMRPTVAHFHSDSPTPSDPLRPIIAEIMAAPKRTCILCGQPFKSWNPQHVCNTCIEEGEGRAE